MKEIHTADGCLNLVLQKEFVHQSKIYLLYLKEKEIQGLLKNLSATKSFLNHCSEKRSATTN